MIESWSQQSWKIPLFVSVSSTEELRAVVMRTLEILSIRHARLNMRLTHHQLKQFQHYKLLVDELVLEAPHESWIMFTDDDDLWHSDRARTFARIASQQYQQHQKNKTANGSVATPGPFFVNSAINEDRPVKATSAGDVTKLVRTGTLTVKHSGAQTDDYVHLCLVLSDLAAFLAKCDDSLLAHRYCDVCLVTYARTHPLGLTVFHSENWSYFYRFDEELDQICAQRENDVSELQTELLLFAAMSGSKTPLTLAGFLRLRENSKFPPVHLDESEFLQMVQAEPVKLLASSPSWSTRFIDKT